MHALQVVESYDTKELKQPLCHAIGEALVSTAPIKSVCLMQQVLHLPIKPLSGPGDYRLIIFS